jgi:hypothetical protein
MDVQTTIEQISLIIIGQFESLILFETPIIIKKSPHSWPIKVHGVQYGLGDHLWFINSNEKWQKLEVSTTDADFISSSIYQRIKSLSSVNIDKHTAPRSTDPGV